ncbi:unnamed protein product [Adineta ricciae]|uniref:PiggyBac transposable element-derived protein domain-containing protein n=1 Tax=Adineta ricciae TaxID=249248 RepID=A0A815LV37_ADIRI|nr:unnamed protein product [Adineta ricciae]
MFTSSFNYSDGSALGNNIVRPIDAFNEYISQDIMKLIVNQTNVYGQQRCVEKGKNTTDWTEIDSTQIYSFMGILLIMGFHKLPRIRDYWSNDRNLFTPTVANVMTRAEFQRIFSNIHLATNTKFSSNLSTENKQHKDSVYLLMSSW